MIRRIVIGLAALYTLFAVIGPFRRWNGLRLRWDLLVQAPGLERLPWGVSVGPHSGNR